MVSSLEAEIETEQLVQKVRFSEVRRPHTVLSGESVHPGVMEGTRHSVGGGPGTWFLGHWCGLMPEVTKFHPVHDEKATIRVF